MNMTAYQPNPDNDHDGESPYYFDLGGHASEGEKPVRIDRIDQVETDRRKKRVTRIGKRVIGRTVLTDEDQNPFTNPRRAVVDDEQRAIDRKGVQLLRGWRNIADNMSAPAVPTQTVIPGLEYVDTLVRTKQSVAADWDEREATASIPTGPDPNLEYSDPRFWKRPQEHQS